jgi:hypothetical protein
VGQGKPALGHHLYQVAKTQLETQVPANAQDDDLTLEVPAREEFVYALQPLRHRTDSSSKGHRARFAPESRSVFDRESSP